MRGISEPLQRGQDHFTVFAVVAALETPPNPLLCHYLETVGTFAYNLHTVIFTAVKEYSYSYARSKLG